MHILFVDIALAVLIAAAVFIRGVWPLEPAAGILTQLALLCLALAVTSFALGEPLGGAIAGAATVLAMWRARAAFDSPTPEISDAKATILWANLWRRRRSFEAVQRLALAKRADVVALGEFPEGARPLPAFAAAYPHQFPEDPTRLRDIVLFSRAPFASAKTVYSTWRRPCLVAALSIADETLTVIATHAPVPWTPKRLQMQRRHIAETFASAEGRRAIIVGDFNAAPWSAALSDTGTAERLKLGLRSTWVFPFPLFGIPIDHAFLSPALEGSVTLGPFIGSDHFPIIVSARRKRQT